MKCTGGLESNIFQLHNERNASKGILVLCAKNSRIVRGQTVQLCSEKLFRRPEKWVRSAFMCGLQAIPVIRIKLNYHENKLLRETKIFNSRVNLAYESVIDSRGWKYEAF